MSANNLSKLVTRRISSSTTGVGLCTGCMSDGSPSTLVLFNTPPFSTKNTPERMNRLTASAGGSVFSAASFGNHLRDGDTPFKSPKVRLFKKALRSDASTLCRDKENVTIKSAKKFSRTQAVSSATIKESPKHVDICMPNFINSLSVKPAKKYINDRHVLASLSDNIETDGTSQSTLSRSVVSSVSSPLPPSSSEKLARYSVQISKLTLTPVIPTVCQSSIVNDYLYKNDYQSFQDVDKWTPSPNDDLVYFDTPFREELTKKGLDGLDFKPCILGRGGFGVVVAASYDGKRVAVKMITKNNGRRRSIELSIQNEENALDLIRHPNLVQTFGIYNIGQDHSVVVMEYAGPVHLVSILENSNEMISCQRRLNFVCQCADALQWCHHHEILHLDIKPANIMINDNDHCKLGDFGCSRRISKVIHEKCELFGGTIAYQAPELLQGFSPTFSVDMYSFGITMWQIMSREMPYKGWDPHVIIYKVVSYDVRPTLDMGNEIDIDDIAYDELYQQLWCRNGNDRPNIDQVVERLQSMKIMSGSH